jgi:hypothetical protein
MSKPTPAEKALSIGIVISARADRRLLYASLQSIERLANLPSLVVVVLPRGRDHLFDHREFAGSRLPIHVLTSEGPDGLWLTVGFRVLAPAVDLAIFANEGTIFEGDYVQQVRRRYADWEDLVGMVEIVSHVVKVGPGAALSDINVLSQMREGAFHSVLRQWLRARSLMPTILSLRVAACGKLKFVTFSAFCDWMSYALFLDQLRRRGRTTVESTKYAWELRLSPERRSGFDFGYAIYDRLTRISDYADQPASPRPIHLNPRVEKIKLFAEQALQYVLSPRSKGHIVTVLQGMLTARRDFKARTRTIRREIRELA